MTYDGFEIDMLALGNADSILVTQWHGLGCTRVLVDGGNPGSYETVRGFLRGLGVTHLDHVLATHPHDDHAGGLVPLVQDRSLTIGHVWCHVAQNHVHMALVEAALRNTGGLKRARIITESLATTLDLFRAARARQIPISEPFAGAQVGPLTVVGPTEAYYGELVAQFGDAEAIRSSEQLVTSAPTHAQAGSLLEAIALVTESLDDNPQTQPENNSSAILALPHASGVHLLTGDAGAQALACAAASYNLANCHWMQIPHHGSRRNITKALIEHFKPTVAFVSAEGSVKHPRRAVVNAFKQTGCRVYSTHYPNETSLWHHRGNVPQRGGYSTATALWDADK